MKIIKGVWGPESLIMNRLTDPPALLLCAQNFWIFGGDPGRSTRKPAGARKAPKIGGETYEWQSTGAYVSVGTVHGPA